MPAPSCTLKVAPTDCGCCIRVEGRGTMQESYAANAIAQQTLRSADNAAVVFDLSDCTYLDSTFLGLLPALTREAGQSKPSRFLVAAPPQRIAKLLGPMKLDRIIPTTDTLPPLRGQYLDIPTDASDQTALARHVMDCHRRLAELGGPTQAAFTRIADQLERELESPKPH